MFKEKKKKKKFYRYIVGALYNSSHICVYNPKRLVKLQIGFIVRI